MLRNSIYNNTRIYALHHEGDAANNFLDLRSKWYLDYLFDCYTRLINTWLISREIRGIFMAAMSSDDGETKSDYNAETLPYYMKFRRNSKYSANISMLWGKARAFRSAIAENAVYGFRGMRAVHRGK